MAINPNTRETVPAENAFEITPSDSTDLSAVARSIYVGGAGNLKVITAGGDTVTFYGIAGGSVLPVRVSRVLLTGTSATNLVAIY